MCLNRFISSVITSRKRAMRKFNSGKRHEKKPFRITLRRWEDIIKEVGYVFDSSGSTGVFFFK